MHLAITGRVPPDSSEDSEQSVEHVPGEVSDPRPPPRLVQGAFDPGRWRSPVRGPQNRKARMRRWNYAPLRHDHRRQSAEIFVPL